jgi:predicted dehydrogenase
MSIDVCVVGGGMIVHDQILPSLYHLQRTGAIGQIDIAATSSARIRDLLNERFERAFPGQSFRAHPAAGADPGERQPGLYKEVVAGLAPRNLVLVATPDPLHYEMVRFALEHDQHVLCVKPLVQTIKHAFELEKLRGATGAPCASHDRPRRGTATGAGPPRPRRARRSSAARPAAPAPDRRART